MQITVLGATGQLGLHVLNQALDAGHLVVAHVRSPDKLTFSDHNLRVVQGSWEEPATFTAAIDGTDAVISCVGFTKGQAPATYGEGMGHVLSAMKAAEVSRLITISGAGLVMPGDAMGLGRRLIIAALKLLARDVLTSKELEWAAIQPSGIDWTLVRVARMIDTPSAGGVEVDTHKVSGKPMVAYRDVAAWILQELEDGRYVQQAPFISGR